MGHMGQIGLCSEYRFRPVCGKASAIAPVEVIECSSFTKPTANCLPSYYWSPVGISEINGVI